MFISLDKVEDEIHFLVECPKYKEERDILFKDISTMCPNFINLSTDDKFLWLTSNEDLLILKNLGKFIIKGFELRQNWSTAEGNTTIIVPHVLHCIYMFISFCTDSDSVTTN